MTEREQSTDAMRAAFRESLIEYLYLGFRIGELEDAVDLADGLIAFFRDADREVERVEDGLPICAICGEPIHSDQAIHPTKTRHLPCPSPPAPAEAATRAEDGVARDLDLEAIERRARELWSTRFHEDMRGYPWQQHNGVPSPFRSWAHEQAYRAALAASSRAPSPPAPVALADSRGDSRGSAEASAESATEPRWRFGPRAAAHLIAATSWPWERREDRDEWSVRLIDEPDLLATEAASARARLEAAIAALGGPSRIGNLLVTHADPEEYARIWNVGYEAAVTQGLADDPSLADDWLQERLREAQARALDDAARELIAASRAPSNEIYIRTVAVARILRARAAALREGDPETDEET